MKRLFEDDIEERCSELTKDMYADHGSLIKMKETCTLLFSDLL